MKIANDISRFYDEAATLNEIMTKMTFKKHYRSFCSKTTNEIILKTISISLSAQILSLLK
jgi:hypothetical protein